MDELVFVEEFWPWNAFVMTECERTGELGVGRSLFELLNVVDVEVLLLGVEITPVVAFES